ncbi:MAG: dihydropteroate synthase [Firmicutes bacterium]|nr:dihydropteroate synthase [Bacillota bacterium]
MDRIDFKKMVDQKIIVLDGAFGTELQKKGMPTGVCPEQWVLEHPDSIVSIQKDYLAAGSNAVYTCTFGGNRIKLEEFGLADQVLEINRKLAILSREAVGELGLVAGDLSITGRFIRPLGELPFEYVVEVYKEQVQGLLEGGVDCFAIETMTDLQEARAAVIAIKESCTFPIWVTMTFDEDGRTLTGTDPVTALITLQSLGVDAFGCNCSTGPEKMIKFIEQMKPYAKVPLIAKPNAGLPKLIDGKTVFSMGAVEFGTHVNALLKAGVNLIGGCCGTSSEYIKAIKERVQEFKKPIKVDSDIFSAITSTQKTVFIGSDQPLTVIGERINPTGKKKLQEELKEGKTTEVRRLALEQTQNGAEVLDVNVGMPGIDEKSKMVEIVELLSSMVEAPLCIDSSNPEVLEAALRIYPGRAVINSISGEKEKMAKLLPIAAKYGAMFVLLPLGDDGLPETAEKRIRIVEQVYTEAEKYGLKKQDIIVDGLVLTVSSDQAAARETLKLISWTTNIFKTNSNIGLSNVSYGLPERSWINAAFLGMSIGSGLTVAIANPSSDLLMNIKRASDVLTGNDKGSRNYLKYFTERTEPSKQGTFSVNSTLSSSDQIYQDILKGNKESIADSLDRGIKEGRKPGELVERCLIPAITEVGELYEAKKYFLPQLIQSAEALKKAFGILEPLLKQNEAEFEREKPKVILATVKGDIHDIGKNIVALMLRNFGFEVFDLGKDVATEEIIEKAKALDAKIVGLSALMTTTMVEMKQVISLAKKVGLKSKFMIGGAVVTEQYAEEIGADAYAEDAQKAVKLARKLVETFNKDI